jgi:aryl-alcohol dehydrogenase-like predicted oxidoreductase
MNHRRLGNSGLLVSELALGTMIFGERSERGVAAPDARRIIARYLDLGGNHFDIADVYAGGEAEAIVGDAVKSARDRLILTTKVRWSTGTDPNDAGLSRYHIMGSVEASLRRLQTDRIDVLYMHGWDAWTPLGESLRAFDDLVAAGKVRYVGVSNFKAWQVMKALGLSDQNGWARFVAAQFQYSLVVRDIEPEFLDLCETEGVGLVPWGPLGGGFLSGKYRPEHRPTAAAEGRLATTPDAWEESWNRRATERNWKILAEIEEICGAHSASTASQVALAWLLGRPAVASIVVGARTLEQLDDNIRAVDVKLTSHERSQLDGASATPLAYPYRGVNSAMR